MATRRCITSASRVNLTLFSRLCFKIFNGSKLRSGCVQPTYLKDLTFGTTFITAIAFGLINIIMPNTIYIYLIKIVNYMLKYI